MTHFAKTLVLASLLSLGLGRPAAHATELDGYWIDSDGEVVLEVDPCGEQMCAKVVWLRLPYGPDRKPLKDFRNSDPALKERPVCGLEVIKGFTKQSDGTWGGGDVYVPDLGMSFKGYAKILSPKQIEVTGYVLLPMLGSSEVWSRIPKPAYHCEKDGVPPAQPLPQSAGP